MNELLDNIIPLLITAGVIIIGGAIGVRIGLPRLIAKTAMRKLPAEEKVVFAQKQELLEHESIVELYAPSNHFMKEIKKEDKSRLQAHWLSPYPEAVKAANKRHKPSKASRRVLMARAQIAEAARHISITVLPDELQPSNAGAEHFFITLQLNGNPEGKIKSLEGAIKAQLGLHSMKPTDSDDYRTLRYIAHAVEPKDRLELFKFGSEFFDQYPAEKPTLIPLAVKADGSPWSLPTHHTLIHGTTGSGKGSPIQGMIRQLEPFINQGIVELYGIDPKNAEITPYDGTSLFKAIAVGENQPMAALILHVHQVMKTRQASITRTKENDFGRSIPITKDTPMVVLIIDELLSLLSALKNMGNKGKDAHQKLTEILAQGRSGNIFVVAATQAATKELMGDMRENFINKIVLRLEDGSDYWNDLWLGDGASSRGFNAMSIAPSNKANEYATAGIGYVKEVTGDPVKIRFAFTNEDDIDAIMSRNPKSSTPEPDVEDDGGFSMDDLDAPFTEGFPNDALPELPNRLI